MTKTRLFSLRADRSLIRSDARSRRHLLAELCAPEMPPRADRRPVSLAFVIDRSGSMDGAKLAYACQAVSIGIRSLRKGDRFAVVAYDDKLDVVVPSVEATPEAREAAVAKVERISAGGTTDLQGGWSRGCDQVMEQLTSDAVGRCLLLTDGLANAGITEHDEIVRQAAGWRDRRVVTTTFGLGEGFDEELLRRMADAGGGNFHFIESAAQIADFVASEVGEALTVAAREALLVVDAGEGAVVESVNDFPCREVDGRFQIRLGSLFAGQSLESVIRVTFPKGAEGEGRDVSVQVEDADGALGQPRGSVRFTWAGHDVNDRQPRDRAVDRRVAAFYAARAERGALELNRIADYAGARRVLELCLEHIRGYAGDDSEILALVENLKRQQAEFEVPMDSISRKSSYSAANFTLKSRISRRPVVARQGMRLLAEPDLVGLVQPVIEHLAAADADLFANLTVEAMEPAWVVRPGVRLDYRQEDGKLARALRHGPPVAVNVVFTTAMLFDNRFSHWHVNERAAVVSMPSPATAGVDPRAFVAYEIVQHGLRLLGPAWAPERLAHAESRGCVFDVREHRTDIDAKLQTANLCPSCDAALAAAGIPADRLRRLLEVIRTLAAPAEVVH